MNPKHKEKEIGIQAEHLLKEAAPDDLELLRILKARSDSLENMQKDLKRYVSSGKSAQKLLNEGKN